MNTIYRLSRMIRLLGAYFDIDMGKIYTLYHSSPLKNLDSIVSQGLIPKKRMKETGKPWLSDVVWMADSPEDAEHHGLKQLEKKGIEDGLVVLEIKFDPKEKNLFKALAPGFFTTDENIPPEWITVHDRIEASASMRMIRKQIPPWPALVPELFPHLRKE